MSLRRSVLALLAALAAVLLATPVALAAQCPPYWDAVSSPAYHTGEDNITGISARAEDDAWTAGTSDHGGFVQSWDGTSWSTSLSPVATDAYFDVATTSSDVWVVGERRAAGANHTKTVVRRWNGTSWSKPATPNGPAGSDNRLEAVFAVADGDVWAVGESFGPTDADDRILLLHWDGISWSAATPPDLSPGGSAQLRAVFGTATGDVWAAGSYLTATDGSGYWGSLVLHWNGVDWTQVPAEDVGGTDFDSATDVWAGTAFSSGDAWLAGGYSSGSGNQLLIEHYNAVDWTGMTTPTIASPAALYGIAALGDADVWAVGGKESLNAPTLALHYEGSSWDRFPTPDIAGERESLDAVASTPGGNLWAGGSRNSAMGTLVERLCPIQVGDAGFSVPNVTVPQGAQTAWSFPSSNAADHTIADNSGMNLFSTGMKSPGGSDTFRFDSAATYGVDDSPSGDVMEVRVPLQAASAPGLKAKITWSAAALSGSRVFDVEVRPPGAASFVPWKTGVTTLTGTYTASHSGNFRFRARLRDSVSGDMTDWSPVKVFFIS